MKNERIQVNQNRLNKRLQRIWETRREPDQVMLSSASPSKDFGVYPKNDVGAPEEF